MPETRFFFVIAVVAVLALPGCGGDNDSTPTQPSPTTTAKLVFEPNFLCGDASVFCPSASETPSPTVSVALTLKLPSSCAVSELTGTLTWDANVARNTAQTLGPYMQQGGVTPSLTVSRTANSFTFTITRPNNANDVSGEGIFLTLPFTVAPNATAGAATTLHWSSAAAYPRGSLSPCVVSGRDQNFVVIVS